jgi:microcystin-dependent protein
VAGALGLLCEGYNWEQHGTLTPAEAADVMQTMWDAFVGEGGCMIGQVAWFAVDTLPDYCLPCSGGTFNRVDYPLLYDAIASTFIINSDTFHTPDIEDRFILAGGTVGATGGEENHTLTESEMPSHTHTIPGSSCFPYGSTPEVCVSGSIVTQNTGATGGGQAHNNMPPYIRLKAGIVAR